MFLLINNIDFDAILQLISYIYINGANYYFLAEKRNSYI